MGTLYTAFDHLLGGYNALVTPFSSWKLRRRLSKSSNIGTYSPFSITLPRFHDNLHTHSAIGFRILLASLLVVFASTPANAAYVPFENCLEEAIVKSNPQQLQFRPLFVWASFTNTPSESRKLSITVYGNVTGIATQEAYPPPDDPHWTDPKRTAGKIVDLDVDNNVYTTLTTRLDVVSFTPFTNRSRFCDSMVQGDCPVTPIFDSDGSDPSKLRSFSVSHDLDSGYAFTSISPTLKISSGDANGTPLGCITADIAPDLGSTLRNVLAFIPLVILVLVGIATITAATLSPWGSLDPFRWTSNYGRDEDLLRLVTPGFADCLQYIQFIILTGSLTLNYPAYFQPVVSQVGWSSLMFNQSFVSNGNGTQPLVDGVYSFNATYGLDKMRQLIGMSSVTDMWAGMVVWLLVIVTGVTIIIQLGFLQRWIYRQITHIPEEDLRAKNMPFTVGNIVRVVFNYFLLPVVSLSMFQLVVTSRSPAFTVGLAVVLLVALIGFATWLLILITRTRPRSYLFDDLPTVLLYGPLYNTFSDGAATFSVISVLLTFVRGIAIGAVQPSGIAQIVLLAICEIVLVLTLTAFRPFPSPSSMNLYHAIFAIIRCLTMLLSVAFVPSLRVATAARGWIGYVILLLHAIVLLFGFFLNSIQTLIEVIARLAGAGGEGGIEGGAARGGLVKVFGMRQLSRRVSRKRHIPRHSMNSEAAMLGNDHDRASTQLDGTRTRSFSGSSALLLSAPGESRVSAGYEIGSTYGPAHSRSGSAPYTPTTPGAISAFSMGPSQQSGSASPRAGVVGIKQAEPVDLYYRPPRQRRGTLEGASPGSHGRSSWASGGWAKGRPASHAEGDDTDPIEGPSISGRGTPTPAYLAAPRDDPDGDGEDLRTSRTDYAVREVDFYYRVRGPALSSAPTRKLKTGPADPTSPMSSATGWFRGLFGGKTIEKGKGFEVVRSARAPPPGLLPPSGRDSFAEPYRDNPENAENAATTQALGEGPRDEASDDHGEEGQKKEAKSRMSTEPPLLPPIESADAIELPSRVGSRREPLKPEGLRIRPPTIPRKSSKRNSTIEATDHNPTSAPQHLETGAVQLARLPFGSKASSTRSDLISTESADSSMNNVTDDETPRARRGSHRRNTSGRTSEDRHGRPSGLGYVQQYRTSDNIHKADSDDEPLSGSTAEFIGLAPH
ncbi:hypothetical protein AJ80_05857 [Polytolypa hystricis UAMH7299]|uniref:ML-like domain-containing protein n=1 Tax=Polytolypa hystricis (strain UAMH7299) TaxID=1447883 RepID=A0A2B7Y1F2_POLH7|nr:hypothetical protein AJ80_05857 [Polytolypa hystricis UAMH7299]